MTESPSLPIKPVDLAVVGHTNTGKTSLLRTLLRDEKFGDVADEPGTTRQVESARVHTQDGRAALILRDTPGLEDAMGALDYLDRLVSPERRLDGPDRIERLLDSPESSGRFEQECRVLRAVLHADAALYVIDTRDPVLPKHRDELTLLAACGRPVLPVLNFTRSPQADCSAWRDALGRLGLHATADFDTVAPALDGEEQLLDRLGLLLQQRATTLKALRADLAEQRLHRLQDATRLIAELMMDAAALRLPCSQDPADIAAITQALRKRTRDREQDCVAALLKRYRFSRATFPHHPLPLEGERWGTDLFSPAALRDFGVQLGKGVATGAMAGATIDAFTGGLSLGAAALIGAALGGLWQGTGSWGKRLLGRLAGNTEITVSDPVLQLLGLRQLALVRALEMRGHAALAPIADDLVAAPPAAATSSTSEPAARESTANEHSSSGPADSPATPAAPPTLPGTTLAILREARGHPEWSTLGDGPQPDGQRDVLVARLAKILFSAL